MPPLNPSSQNNSPSPPTIPSTTVGGGVINNNASNNCGIRKRCGTVATSATPRAKAATATVSTTRNKKFNINGILHQKQLDRLGEVLAGPSRAIAPIAIIGGTISVYSSAIQLSNNADFTPISIIYLLLLALNYAIMPRLSKRYIHPSTNKQSVALTEEVVKMSLGMGGWILTSYVTASKSNLDSSLSDTLANELQNWSPLSTLVAAGLPSALYALQGTLTYTAYQHLDAVTFNGLTQLKVLSSALCCYIVLGKRQSSMQLCSLGLLMMSTVIFQGSWKDWLGGRRPVHESKTKKSGTVKEQSNGNNRRLLLGVLPCLAATLLSGLAGAFSQKSLQMQVGMMHRNAYFYTVEISFLSAVCLMLSMGAEWWKSHRSTGNDKRSSSHFFEHWTCATLLPIATKATAGLLTALVHRHLGSVIKGFALVLGLVFSALLQFVLEGVDLTIGQLVGTALVLLSSWLHFTSSAT